jgi:hypothetical protein
MMMIRILIRPIHHHNYHQNTTYQVSIQIGRQHFLRKRAEMDEDELYKVQNKRGFRKDAMIQPENLLNKHVR